MGLRINIHLGFGLDISGLNTDVLRDLMLHDGECSFMDEFWNELTEACSLYPELSYPHESYYSSKFSKNEEYRYEHGVIYQEEFGYENKLLLQPAFLNNQWSRVNDDIDYQMARMCDPDFPEGQEWMGRSWKQHSGSLYPFDQKMRANKDTIHGFEAVEYNFEDLNDNGLLWRPPLQLWYILRRLKLAPENQTGSLFLKLKPTIYRYWC